MQEYLQRYEVITIHTHTHTHIDLCIWERNIKTNGLHVKEYLQRHEVITIRSPSSRHRSMQWLLGREGGGAARGGEEEGTILFVPQFVHVCG